MSELSRLIDRRLLPASPVAITAGANECTALARRFGLVRIDRLEASVTLEPEGRKIEACGRLSAKVVQSCAVSGEDLPVTIDEPVFMRFVPAGARHSPDEEIELGAADCDEIEMDGTQFDLGEAIAQSLALAIDPFAVGPGAEQARQAAGLLDPEASGPFAALKALKKDG
jgi:hypothetical protein